MEGARHQAVARAQRVLRARSGPAAPPAPVAAPVFASPGAGTPVIDVENVSKTYAVGEVPVRALRGVSLQVQPGEYMAIMGSSGSGKSTLMNILGCLDSPTDGVYRLNGIDVRELDEDTLSDLRGHYIGFVFQSFNLIPRTRAVVNVELPLAYAGLPRAQRRERALSALDHVGLADRVEHLPSELSGGQQQRVAIARALVTAPAMILADEPTGNLDTASGAEVLGILERLNEQGSTIVLITHEAGVAEHAQRIVRLSDGLVISDELVEDRRTPV